MKLFSGRIQTLRIFLFSMTCLLLSAAPVSAHTVLSDSVPADNQSLTTSPDALRLTFADPVRLMRIELKDGDGRDIALGFRPAGEPDTGHEHALPKPLAPGDYTLNWRALASDGHAMTGSIRFTIESADD